MKNKTLFAALLLSACTSYEHTPAPVYNAAVENRDTSQPVVMVNKGDDVMQLAKKNGLTIEDILLSNDLMDMRQVQNGARLFVPASGSANGPTMPTGQKVAYEPLQTASLEPMAYPQPSNASIERETLAPLSEAVQPIQAQQVQTAMTTPQQATPAAEQAAPQQARLASSLPPEQWRDPMSIGFRRPVSGPTLSNFGQKMDGLRNDGINIGALNGTPVEAAADGEVVYAGNAVEGFGNLVLIKHKNNVVTAYGHLGRADVTKGQIVKAGDIIGGVGESGSVTAPQLHFQIRQGGKILDPSPYLRGGPTTQTAGL